MLFADAMLLLRYCCQRLPPLRFFRRCHTATLRARRHYVTGHAATLYCRCRDAMIRCFHTLIDAVTARLLLLFRFFTPALRHGCCRFSLPLQLIRRRAMLEHAALILLAAAASHYG